MCGRFTSLTPPEELATLFAADLVDDVRTEVFQPNFNVAPSMQVLAVAWTKQSGRRLGRLKWGLVPEWAKTVPGTGHVNARSETVADKPSFRDSFERRRCIIPMSGYYEWRTVDNEGSPAEGASTRKRAVYVTRSDRQPLAVAGLWSTWVDRSRHANALPEEVEDPPSPLKTCCVITREANALLSSVHDRMPVVLDRRHWSAWLGEVDDDSGFLREILNQSQATDESGGSELMMIDVGQRVNNVRNNSPDLITRIA